MAGSGTMAAAGWRVRRSLVVLVVGALLASLLAVSPVEAQEVPLPNGDSSELSVDVATPDEVVDGAATIEGTVDLGGEEVVTDTSAVLVFDVSGSARWAAADCTGNGSVDSMLTCERVAMRVFVEAAAEVGSVGEVAAVAFGSRAQTADVSPESGFQVFTAPGADDNDSGTYDVLESIYSMGVGGRFTRFTRTGRTSTSTNTASGLAAACSALAGASYPNHLVVVLSDGGSNRGTALSNVVPCDSSPDAVFETFAVGQGVDCDTGSGGRGSLNDIAELTGGTCEFVEDPGILADLLEGLARPELQRLELSVNGGERLDISDSLAVEVPVRGPVEVDFAHLVEGLAGPVDEVCVTAIGRRGNEVLESTTCVEVVSNEPPVADAGGDQVVVEGSLVTLDGSGSYDPDDDPLSYGWSLVSVSGPPVVLSSATEPQVSFLALDDGEYVLELAVSDGRATATDRAVVTVENAAPEVEASVGSGEGGGGVTMLSATFTDPGPLDVHSATVEWGDGSDPVPVEVSNQGTGWGSVHAAHRYTEPGSYVVALSVVDDDGGETSVEVGTAEVEAPMAVWATGDDRRSISISGSSSTIRGRSHANGGVRTAGSSHGFDGLLTYVGSLSLAGAHHEFDPEPQQTGPADPPVELALEDYRPGGRAAVTAGAAFHDMSDACGSTWSPETVLEPGLYWAPCEVHIAGAHVFAGPVTIAAEGSIRVTGAAGEFFEPFVDGALFVSGAGGSDAVRVAGAGSTFVGLVNAEGEVHINGSGHRFVCGMVGEAITISGTDNLVDGADCAAPDRTAAAPSVVPELSVDYSQDPAEATPGDTLEATVAVTNDGARLVAPAIAGVENLGDAGIEVTGGSVALEHLPAGASEWVPLGVPAETSARPLPAPGVGTPTGADPFAGVTVEPGAVALWGIEVTATIDPTTMAQLLDPAQVTGLRVVTDLDLDPAGAPVRRLVHFGPDILDDVRADGGVVTDAEALVVLPDGSALRVTSAEVPAFGELAVGATATETFEVTVPVPAGPGATESTEAYVARLAALDDTLLSGGAFAYGTGGPGRLLAPMASDATTRRVPVLATTLSGPDTAVAGDELSFEVGVANQGSAAAGSVAATAVFDGEPVEVTGLGESLPASGLDSGSIAATVPVDAPSETLGLDATVGWSGTNGTAYGPVVVSHGVEVTAGAALDASMGWFLETDNTGNGLPSPGDVIGYEATITNRGDSPATDVAVELPLDPSSALVTGSVVTTSGVVAAGNDPADTAVSIADATIAPDGQLVVEALVEIPTDIDDAVRFLEAQATIGADGVDPVATDDPARFGTNQPTRTNLVRLVPVLYVAPTEYLGIDADGNAVASSGDTLGYVVEVFNGGTGPASAVTIDFAADPDTTVVDATSTHGEATITDGQVTVDAGGLGDDEPVEVHIGALISPDLAAGTELVAEWTVDATNVAGTPITEVVTVELGAAVDPGEGEGPGGDVGGLPTGGTAEIAGLVPADGGVVTEPTEVSVGTITPTEGESITEWILTTYPAGADPGEGTVLGEGTGDPSGSTLGVFDPTTRANGIWTVRLVVTDSTGAVSFAESGLVVDGQLKLGRYVVSYEDLAVPVAGIPIQVLRTYDTLNRDSEGDFGFGWNLELANFRVQTNRTLGLGPWTGESCGAGLVFVPLCFAPGSPRFVTVTWPDGRTESFDLTPTGNTFFATAMVPEYTPRAGATSSLSPAPGDTTAGRGGDGHMRTGGFGDGAIYDPQRFVLTAADGTEYLLDRDTGLVSATDRNGNSITVTPDGVSSSAGPGITFERDAQGRIDTIVGPDGATITYGYDPAGDLIAVTDPNGHTTSHAYEDHYLIETVDPTGAPWRRLDYDPDSGHLSGITDANGHTTAIATDVGERTQVVTSPDGRLTTISSFDARGNELVRNEIADGVEHPTTFTYSDDGLDLITGRTDPEGNTWSGDYDSDGNLVRFVDAEGHETVIDYDGFGFPTRIVDAAGGVTRFDYDAFGNLTRLVDALDAETTFVYDSRGNRVSRVDAVGNETTWGYTPQGWVATRTSGEGHVTRWAYDTAGRVISESDETTGASTTWAYDPVGNLVGRTDPEDNTTGWVYDSADRVVAETDPAGHTTSYGYDPVGNLEAVIDPLDAETLYSYDPMGRLVSRVDPLGHETTWVYDGAGRLVETVDARGAVTGFGYDLAGRRTSVSAPERGTTTMSLDGNGRVVAETNGEDETTSFGFDPMGRLVSQLDPTGRETRWGFDAAGRLVETVAPGERTTSYGYDPAGRMVSIIDPTDAETAFGYDADGNQTTVTDPLGHTTTRVFDSTGRTVSVTDPAGAATSYSYDLAGRLTRTTGADGDWVEHSYDPRGLVVDTSDALGHSTTSSYDAAGRRVTEVDPRGNPTQFGYDPLGRVTSMTNALGGQVAFGYDPVGNQVLITDPNGATRFFEHNLAGDVIAEIDALDQVTSHAYDLVGRRVSTTDAAGYTTSYSFDPAGRLIGETRPDAEITFGYSVEGWRNQMVDPTGTTTWGHDPAGRVTEVDSAAGTITYGYDDAGQLTDMSGPMGAVAYTYDPAGRVATLTNDLGTTNYTWTPGGRPHEIIRPNGTTTANSYDPAGRLVGIDHVGPDGLIARFGYTLDPAGNRIGVDTLAGTETYTLDELNRLTEATYGDGTSESFAYDPAGNRTSHTDPDGTTTHTYDPSGQLIASSGPDGELTFTHDPVGRLTAISDGTTYTYNTAGQLTEATVDGTTHTYRYDADGIRVEVDGQPQLWDRNQPLPMLVHDGEPHTWGPDGQLLTTGDAWAHTDALGSIRAHTNTTGDLTTTIDYRAFGTPTSTWDTFGHTAGIHDPTGLIHLRARNHHPALGRFTTRDPIQPGAPGTGGYNHYTYVANNPTTWVDPTGRVALMERTPTDSIARGAAPPAAKVGLTAWQKFQLMAGAIAGGVGVWCGIHMMYQQSCIPRAGGGDGDDAPDIDRDPRVVPAYPTDPRDDQGVQSHMRPVWFGQRRIGPGFRGGPPLGVTVGQIEAGDLSLTIPVWDRDGAGPLIALGNRRLAAYSLAAMPTAPVNRRLPQPEELVRLRDQPLVAGCASLPCHSVLVTPRRGDPTPITGSVATSTITSTVWVRD